MYILNKKWYSGQKLYTNIINLLKVFGRDRRKLEFLEK